MNGPENLKQLLHKGLYLDNLDDMMGQCRKLMLDTEDPLPYYVLSKIFFQISSDWDDRPLPVEEAKAMEQRIGKAAEKVLSSLADGEPVDEVWRQLNGLVRAFIRI